MPSLLYYPGQKNWNNRAHVAQARDLLSMHAPLFGLRACFNFFGQGSSSALSCLLRSHHVLLFRLVASDCLSCSAKLGRSVVSSSLALSFSMPLASCLHLLSCYSARILSALLCHEAASIWDWEARLRLSHQGTQTNLCVLCVYGCRGENHGLRSKHKFCRKLCLRHYLGLRISARSKCTIEMKYL